MYDAAANLWHDLFAKLSEQTQQQEDERAMAVAIERAGDGALTNDQARFRDVNADSDDEGEEMTKAEETAAKYRRKCRNRNPSMVRSLYWVSAEVHGQNGMILVFTNCIVFYSHCLTLPLSLLWLTTLPGGTPTLLPSYVYRYEGRFGN